MTNNRHGEQEFTLVFPKTRAGEHFIRYLQQRKLPVAAISNNQEDNERLNQLGVEHVLLVDPMASEPQPAPELPIGGIYLFDSSLSLCSKLLQICRRWTSKHIFVITDTANRRFIYRSLGADFVVYSRSSDVTFLVDGGLSK